MGSGKGEGERQKEVLKIKRHSWPRGKPVQTETETSSPQGGLRSPGGVEPVFLECRQKVISR